MNDPTIEFGVLPVPVLVAEICKYRPISTSTFHRKAKDLGIKHAGYAVRPRLYRVADGERILHALGFPRARIVVGQPTPAQTRVLATLPELRKERRKGRAAR